MRETNILIILATALLSTHSPILAADCDSLAGLEWMLGDWLSVTNSTAFREHWERHPDGHFTGYAESGPSDGKEVSMHETLTLVQRDGRVQYVADVAHNEHPVAFGMVSCDEGAVVFENADHDFPQRIAYRRLDSDHINAHISDLEGQGFELHFQRAAAARPE